MAQGKEQQTDEKWLADVVREVLSRLMAETMRSPEPTAATKPTPGQLTLGEKLISVALLEGRLGGVATLVVRPRTVVTPAARDLLREKNIAVTYAASERGGISRPRLAVGVAAEGFDPAALLRQATPLTAEIQRLPNVSLSGVIEELSEAVVKGGCLGLLLASEADLAACLANRHRGVRAAIATGRDGIAAARRTLGVNLLIVDPTRRSLPQLFDFVKVYLQGGLAPCPASLHSQLQ